MALVESLLSAIVRADGDALVMHVGERPYVVAGTGTINISTHGLTLEMMTGMLSQLLPVDGLATLEEDGAVEHRLNDVGDDRFNVVAARGGDDIWIEIRRRRNKSDAAVAAAAAAAPPELVPEPAAVATGDAAAAEARRLAEIAYETQRVAARVAAEEAHRVVAEAAAEEERRLAVEAAAAEERRRAAEAAAEEERRVAAEAAAEEERRLAAEVAAAEERLRAAEAAVEEERRVAAEAAAEEERRLAAEVAAAEERRRTAEAAAEEERRIAAEAAAEETRRIAAEEERRLLAAEVAAAEERRRAAEAAAEEARRVAAEAAAEEERRLAAEVAAAEERRRAAEAALEEERRLAEAALEQERRLAAEVAAAEERRRAAEAAAEDARRVAAEIAAAESRRLAAEAAAAEERRRVAEAAAEEARRLAAEAAAEEARRIAAQASAEEERRRAAELEAQEARQREDAAAEEERRRAEAAALQAAAAPELGTSEPAQPELTAAATIELIDDEAADADELRRAKPTEQVEGPRVEPAIAAQSTPAPPLPAMEPEPLRAQPVEAMEPLEAAAYAAPSVILPMTRTVRIEVPPRIPASRSSDIERLLRTAAARGASALFLTSESPPHMRVDGDIRLLENEAALTRSDVEAAIVEIAPESGQQSTAMREATEWLKEYPELGRIRCTTFTDHRGPGLMLRMIATRAATAEQLGLSREVQALATEPQGLVLVAGPRASGKSTLMSALVDLVNRQRAEFVITLERQIRLVHDNKAALVSQREIRGGAEEALAAARSALRENPDVLVVDDLISPHMVPLILTAASEGLLVFVSIAAPSTSDAVQRFVELASPEMRTAVQSAMGESFRGAVAQVLLKKSGGGLVAAREVLLATAPVARVIGEGQLAQLPHALESGRKLGMVSFSETLLDYVRSGSVDVREAFRKAPDRDRLLAGLKREGVDTSLVERLA